MNSSVTFDSAISVTSSLCLPISCRSRSNGPSKLTRCTVKRDGAVPSSAPSEGAVSGTAPVLLLTAAEPRGPMVGSAPQSLDEDRVLASLVEVGEQDSDRLADDPAPVGGHAVLPAQD